MNAYAGGTQAEGKALATRQSSQAALNAFGPSLPELLGGSADLTPSNGTWRKDSVTLGPDSPGGNYLHFGVREFGMSAMHERHAPWRVHPVRRHLPDVFRLRAQCVRMAGLMRLRVIFVYTHDSIGSGEDGPTHQPIEHLASLRLIPHMDLWRPCDAVETAAAWALRSRTATDRRCLIFTRQSCTHQPRDAGPGRRHRARRLCADRCGGGRPRRSSSPPVPRSASQPKRCAPWREGRKVRLVSMPSTHTFDAQDDAYKQSVLPAAVTRRVAVEAGVTAAWWHYVGLKGEIVGIDHFGASAPAKDVVQGLRLHAAARGRGDRKGASRVK